MNDESFAYTSLPGFEAVYLEDSFVLDIRANPGQLRISLDLVLTPQHPEYTPPKPQEQHCYRSAIIEFLNVRRLVWDGQGMIRPATDATGAVDYGGVDSLTVSAGVALIEGDWGVIEVESDPPVIRLHP